jgi:hypothetical protein
MIALSPSRCPSNPKNQKLKGGAGAGAGAASCSADDFGSGSPPASQASEPSPSTPKPGALQKANRREQSPVARLFGSQLPTSHVGAGGRGRWSSGYKHVAHRFLPKGMRKGGLIGFLDAYSAARMSVKTSDDVELAVSRALNTSPGPMRPFVIHRVPYPESIISLYTHILVNFLSCLKHDS